LSSPARPEGGKRVFEIAVFVERFDEEAKRGAVYLRQTQAQGLAVEEVLQRFLAAGQLGRIGAIVVAQVVVSRGCVAAPFAVVGRHVDGAVAFPVGLGVGRFGRRIGRGHFSVLRGNGAHPVGAVHQREAGSLFIAHVARCNGV